jgi:hypothetical protein
MLVLGALALAALDPALDGALHGAEQARAAAHHVDGAPCPDADGEGPCDDGCPCLCCPGHRTTLDAQSAALLNPQIVVVARSAGPRETAPPDRASARIFRPPRV